MSRTMHVLLVIAIVCTVVEICALAVNYFEPPQFTDEQYLSNMADRAEIRWKIYWFSGFPLAILGVFLSKKFDLPGNALLIAGIYLMMFGNNGGFWAARYVTPRLITTIGTLIFLLFLIRNEQWKSQLPSI